MRTLKTAMRIALKQWFPQRNLIIVSEHKVRHIPISGRMQCVALLLLAGGICWGAYSTGSYMAARMAIKAQSQALRSLASARVASSFNTLYPAPLISDMVNAKTDAAAVNSAMFTVSPAALDSDKLFARVAFLEQKVNELQATNTSIIRQVRAKTKGRIDDLESIIKQVGLNPATLKKEIGKQQESHNTKVPGMKSEGGPYIPGDISILSLEEQTLYSNLDELALLQQAVDILPLMSPIDNHTEQSHFGRRIDPFTGRLAFHSGLDISGEVGAKVHSTAAGIITDAGRNGAYGNMVSIEHGFGISTRYAHLSKVLVKPGQKVKKGDVVGIQGSTGRSTGAHLHYEVRYNNKPVNPKKFLKAGLHVSQE